MPMIVAARRTPIGTAGRALAGVEAADLAAPVIATLASDLVAQLDEAPTEVVLADMVLADIVLADIVLGNCTGPGGDIARVAALAAGLSWATPALTVDRQCASGLAALVVADAMVRATGRPVLAGGVESASTSARPGRARFAPDEIGDPDMGLAADILAEKYGVTRAEQDVYAARSHARAYAAQQAGRFDAELVPVGAVSADERPRDGMTAARLGRLRPAFRTEGTVTAGNSCGINDGAALLAVVPDDDRPGLAILAAATAGVDPNLPGLGLVPAVRAVLEQTGATMAEVDVVELNEAFAGQVIACCRDLDLDPERVCPEGGALALGHPWGASGAVLAVRLFHQLSPGQLGLAAVSAGGGQGVALLVRRVARACP